jgi:hypothetical protein
MSHQLRAQISVAFGLVTLAGIGCVDRQPGISGTQSIGVELVSPANPGSVDPANRIPDGTRAVTVNLTAYDAAFAVDPTFDRDVQVYVQFLGTLTPALGAAPPLATIRMTAGKAMARTVMLPPVFGRTTLWVDDGADANPTYATGTSPALWYRDPTIADLQTPPSETAVDALTSSPLANKQVTVNGSRYGANGRLVVTSVFSQGYTVSDVRCADANGTPPCVAAAYDHMLVFSFSAPRDQTGTAIKEGQVIDGFSGGVSEFNGLTEIGFPATFATSDAVTPDRRPAAVTLDRLTWFGPLSTGTGIINFERNEAGAIEILDGRVCNLDRDYDTFKQWKLDPAGIGGDCSGNRNVLNVITAGVIGDLDPATLVGKALPRVVGMVRPVQIGNFNVWIIFPRSRADLTLQ